MIGITLNSDWFVPFSEVRNNKKAAQRALDFMFGWWVLNYSFVLCEYHLAYAITISEHKNISFDKHQMVLDNQQVEALD